MTLCLRRKGGLGRVGKQWRWSLATESLGSSEFLFPTFVPTALMDTSLPPSAVLTHSQG